MLALVSIAVLATGCSDDVEGSYDADTRASFLEACTEDDADPALRGVCECTYETMVDEVPFERFVEIEAELAAEGELAPELAPEVVAILDDCIDEVSREQG